MNIKKISLTHSGKERRISRICKIFKETSENEPIFYQYSIVWVENGVYILIFTVNYDHQKFGSFLISRDVKFPTADRVNNMNTKYYIRLLTARRSIKNNYFLKHTFKGRNIFTWPAIMWQHIYFLHRILSRSQHNQFWFIIFSAINAIK